MKLFPPQSDCRIYEEGFGVRDLLGRTTAGQRLSELVEKVEDPIVVALDGPWGSGKSYFLRRWVGAHTIENGGKATTVYFDAFANDFFDDPLIALTGAIGERLPSGSERRRWETAKKVAFKLARPIFRIGAAAATAGATELTGPVLDAVIGAGGKEVEDAAEAFWKREDGRKAAMQQFHTILANLTAASDLEEGDSKPLVVVIDELDRCRPDYALAVLEVVKHFFSVSRVHFVLGINMDALEHMVRVRYGVGVNAKDYLKRFISLSMHLPEFIDPARSRRAQIAYFESAAISMGIDKSLLEGVNAQLKLAIGPAGFSLRDIEKILTQLAVLPGRDGFRNMHWGWQVILVSLILFRVGDPELYRAALDRTLSIDEVEKFYGIKPEMISQNSERTDAYNHSAYLIWGAWQYIISSGTGPEPDRDQFAKSFDNWGRADARKILTTIERDFLDLFEVPE